MTNFTDRIKELFFKEKGVDIDNIDYLDAPERKEDYDLSKTIGNVNLTERRFKIKSEADIIINEFLTIPLP